MERSNKSHLAIFTPGFPANEQDTTCIPALQIFIKAFSKKYNGKISILTFQYPYFVNHYQWHDIDIYALGGRNKKFRKYWIWRKAKKIFKHLIQKVEVTQLHSFWMGECAFIASKIAAEYQIPHLCTLMGQDVLPGNRYFRSLAHITKLVTLSRYHHNVLMENYRLESIVIPWGIEKQDNFVAHKDIDIIGVGNLVTNKRFDQFIQVILKLKEYYPDIKTVIVGDGPQKQTLDEEILSSNLAKNVSLLGLRPYDETQRLMARSKVLLHLSESESFGMVTIEALSVQTWVVCRSVGVGAEIDQVVRVTNVEEAAKETRSILEQNMLPEKTCFPVEHTISQYLNLISHRPEVGGMN